MAGTDGSGRAGASRAAMFPRWLVGLLGLLVVGATVYLLRGVLTPLALSLGIAYLLDPLVDRFEARGVPRGLGITLVLAIVAAIMIVFTLLVLPGMVREVVHFASELPGEMQELLARVEPWLAARGVPVPHDVDEALAQLSIAPGELASHAAAPAQALLRFVLGGTASAIGVLASALLVPVLAFYLLYDFDRMTAGARDLVPPRIRPWVVEVAREIDAVIGQFVRGQLLVMLAMGVLYAGAYSLVGVRLAVPIGLVAGLLAFIPYVGGGSALGMALLMCVVDWTGWLKPVLVVIAYLVCQGLEGFVIVPRVVGDKVGLPAVWVLVALMVGGELFGFLGVLLAVPAAAVVKIFVVRGLRWYKQSPLYVEGAGVERVAEVVQRTEAPLGEPPAPIASVPDIAQEIPPVLPSEPVVPSEPSVPNEPVASDEAPSDEPPSAAAAARAERPRDDTAKDDDAPQSDAPQSDAAESDAAESDAAKDEEEEADR